MRWLIAFFLVVGAMLANSAHARGFGCGLEPMTPFSCMGGQAQCVCDENNNCQWFFVGCN